MPALNTKQYVVVCAAAAASKRATPANLNRMALTLQNTGASPGLFRFGGNVRQDGGDLLLAVGATIQWIESDTCPTDDLNFLSVAGTTIAVIETTSGKG